MRARRTMLLMSMLGAASVMTLGLTGTAGAASVTTAPNPDQAGSTRPLPSGPVGRTAATRRLDAYWTASRMQHAKSLDALATGKTVLRQTGTSTKPTVVKGVAPRAMKRTAFGLLASAVSSAQVWPFSYSMPSTTTGKVFFTSVSSNANFQRGDYVCSGSVVNSEAKDTVITAGHCVHGGQNGTWHTNWIFVPDYNYGSRPYGTWYGCQLWSLNGWMNSSDNGYDVGAAVMCDSNGSRITNVVGGQGFWANGDRGQFEYDFGYPAASPFNGQEQRYCTGTTWNTGFLGIGGNLGLQCNLTGGASGGPWLRNFNGSTGYVNGVNSYKYNNNPNQIFSPYFGDGANNLYNTVRALHY